MKIVSYIVIKCCMSVWYIIWLIIEKYWFDIHSFHCNDQFAYTLYAHANLASFRRQQPSFPFCLWGEDQVS